MRCDKALERLVGEYVRVRRTTGEGVNIGVLLMTAVSSLVGDIVRFVLVKFSPALVGLPEEEVDALKEGVIASKDNESKEPFSPLIVIFLVLILCWQSNDARLRLQIPLF